MECPASVIVAPANSTENSTFPHAIACCFPANAKKKAADAQNRHLGGQWTTGAVVGEARVRELAPAFASLTAMLAQLLRRLQKRFDPYWYARSPSGHRSALSG